MLALESDYLFHNCHLKLGFHVNLNEHFAKIEKRKKKKTMLIIFNLFTLRVCLESAYFAEIENFLLKVL